jgi:hypothetical protein
VRALLLSPMLPSANPVEKELDREEEKDEEKE